MSIIIANKKSSPEKLLSKHVNSVIIDVTSKSNTEFIKLSPFYPHGDIPIPFSNGQVAKSVEGIWQGLKVFENMGIDITKFEVSSMKGIKRTVKKYGKVLGHKDGIHGTQLLNYIDARQKIYVPSYQWILNNKVNKLVEDIVNLSSKQNIILLDYETNDNIFNPKKPLSHAALIKFFIENKKI